MSRRPLQMESLEQRQMMAGRANFDLQVAYNTFATAAVSTSGDLVIRGSSGHDNINVARYSFLPDTVFIGLNGSSLTISASSIRSGKVLFSGNEGNDTFSYYDSTSRPMLLTARGGLVAQRAKHDALWNAKSKREFKRIWREQRNG